MHVPRVMCTWVYPLKPCRSKFTHSHVHTFTSHTPLLSHHCPSPHCAQAMTCDVHTTGTAPQCPTFALTCRHETAFFSPLCKPGCTKDSASSHLWDCHPAGKGEGCKAACDSRWWCKWRATGWGWVRDGLRPEEWCPIQQGVWARHGT